MRLASVTYTPAKVTAVQSFGGLPVIFRSASRRPGLCSIAVVNPARHNPCRSIIALALCAAGCTTQPYRDQPLSPGAGLSGYEARTLDSAELRNFLRANLGGAIAPWPPESWDLDLLTLVAFYYHPDLDVVRADWGVAKAAVITAGQRPNPQLVPALGYNATAPIGISPWTLGMFIDIPIETAGKRGYRIAQAAQHSQAARFRIEQAAWQVRSRLRDSLVGLYPIDPMLENQRSRLQELVVLLERRMALGLIAQPEVTQARLALAHTDLALNDIRRQRAKQRSRLAAALGLSSAALDGIALSFADLERVADGVTMPAGDARRVALLNRADVRAALSAYEETQEALRLEIARQYPDFRLRAGYGWDQGSSKWVLGLPVELPVLNRNEGPIAEAQARRAQAAANFLALQARAIGETEQALAAYEFSMRKLKAAATALSARRDNERLTAALLRTGEADRLALVRAAFETASAEQAHTETLIEAQQAVGQLEDALQRPLVGRALPLRQDTNPRNEKEPR